VAWLNKSQDVIGLEIHTAYAFLYFCTVRKTKRDAGPKHEGDRKIRHLHKSGRSMYVDGGIFLRTHVLVLRHDWLFYSAWSAVKNMFCVKSFFSQ
jgi:hypothetical protein